MRTRLSALLHTPLIPLLVDSSQGLPNKKSLDSGLLTTSLYLNFNERPIESRFVLEMLCWSFTIVIKEDFSQLHSTYISPILEYGSHTLHTDLIKDRDSLKLIQRASIKLVKGLFDLLYSARLAELNLYPSNSRRICENLMLPSHLPCHSESAAN